jgi:hypothetical protein
VILSVSKVQSFGNDSRVGFGERERERERERKHQRKQGTQGPTSHICKTQIKPKNLTKGASPKKILFTQNYK